LVLLATATASAGKPGRARGDLPDAFAHGDRIAAKLRGASRILLGLDFDGTCSPIVENRHAATFHPQVLRSLQTLAEHSALSLVFISGRDLKDLQAHVAPVSHRALAGSHGLTVEIPGQKLITAKGTEPFLRRRERLIARIKEIAREHLGREHLVEEKDLAVALHYRGLERAAYAPAVRKVKELATGAGLRFEAGNCVVEILADARGDKGWAFSTLRQQLAPNALPIFAGDDRTDLPALRMAQSLGGLAFFVGDRLPRVSADHRLASISADYRLASIEDMAWLLELIGQSLPTREIPQ
jgi:trehalose 6-phosphate phosphatase